MSAINKPKYDISVLVLTYEPNREKLMKTLRSILFQEGVKLQIIIADDGSVNSLTDEAVSFLQDHNFNDIVTVRNPVNKGTTINFYSGLEVAEGEYLKGISPGDYLFEKDTFSKWLSFMRNGGHDVSFGIPVFYGYNDSGEMEPISRPTGKPILTQLYSEKNYREAAAKLNCFVLEDYIIGASYFAKTKLVYEYCKGLIGKVKYFEDALYRFMLLDGIHSVYYPHEVIMYEYGTGVSTSKSEKWRKIVKEEIRATENLMIESNRQDEFSQKLIQFFKDKHNGVKVLGVQYLAKNFPQVFYWKVWRTLMVRTGKSKTSTACNKEFMRLIGGSDASN